MKSSKLTVDITYIIIGAFLQAFAYSVFIAPANIVPGGIYGTTIVLNHITKGIFSFAPDGLPIGITALFFNVPLLFLAIRKLGLSSGPKTILTFVLIAVFTDFIGWLMGDTTLVANDKFLSAFYGGAILGLGVMCVFKAGSTSAGTDVLARVLAKGTNIKVSTMIMTVDSIVVLFGLLALKDWSVPLYSWLTIFIYGKVVDILQPENPNKAVFIVSPKKESIREIIINKLDMGGTFLHGQGMYNGEQRDIIFTITDRKKINALKREVREIDPNAFISSMDASKDVSPTP
ncbi:YitT family protein [Porphyromonas sp.]|uniref:YitT family protein n=1 Tax=Porphyromonas sp. TaxID=1924944 RepID=UPI0026DBC552|nr:YitT family protein [Porphyromonas sp.]MDO4695368.1 YitT family protein [Porphyromonas sp.]MDO4770369.1 YitT family protein [Porphyromonas sp.]